MNNVEGMPFTIALKTMKYLEIHLLEICKAQRRKLYNFCEMYMKRQK